MLALFIINETHRYRSGIAVYGLRPFSQQLAIRNLFAQFVGANQLYREVKAFSAISSGSFGGGRHGASLPVIRSLRLMRFVGGNNARNERVADHVLFAEIAHTDAAHVAQDTRRFNEAAFLTAR